MASSTNPHITDELLSAYIDNAVTEDERRLVETAVAADPGVAWRLESLRHTVHLLNHLPELAAPRAFALTVEAVSAPPVRHKATSMAAPSRRNQPVVEPVGAGFGGFWQTLLQGGNLFLRNAAAGAALVFLMLVGANFVLPNLQNIELSRTGATTATNAYPGPAVASTQPLATLTQVINAASDAPAVEATPESAVVQPANDQAPIAQSADEPATEPVTEPEALSANAPAVALQSATVSSAVNADDADLENQEAVMAQAALPAVPKQSALAPAADQAAASDAASQSRIAAQPVATPLPQATTAPEMGVGGEAAASEMVTASSVISELEAPAAMSVAQAEAPAEPAPEQPAELALAPAAPSSTDEGAAGAAVADEVIADETVADTDTAEEDALAAEGQESTDAAAADVEAAGNTEGYVIEASPLATPADEEANPNRVAQAPAPEPIEQQAKAESAPNAEAAAPDAADSVLLEAPPAEQEHFNAPAATRVAAGNLLWYAQIIAALCTLGFALLWWRSRE